MLVDRADPASEAHSTAPDDLATLATSWRRTRWGARSAHQGEPDEEHAWSLTQASAGPGVGAWYLDWLREEARAFVVRYHAAILRVADALERHAVWRGDQVAALVRLDATTR